MIAASKGREEEKLEPKGNLKDLASSFKVKVLEEKSSRSDPIPNPRALQHS